MSGAPGPADDDLSGWPASIVSHLRTQYGGTVAVERPGGMSIARVWRVCFNNGSIIVKASPREAESAFYARVAPKLRRAGIPIPRADLIEHHDGMHWLVLEDLPLPLYAPASDTTLPVPEVTAVLARLHRVTRGQSFDIPVSRAGRWAEQQTASMLSWFDDGTRAAITPVLERWRDESRHLPEPWCWISGDPSPPNWGRRTDGSLALFDWELFRPGVPATDIAITVPGLPDVSMLEGAARRYLDAWSTFGEPLPWSLERFVRDMAVSKVGTVVVMMAAQATGAANVPADHIAALVATVPGWVLRLERDLG
jgi:aminoglycoside phosphotransferase (APT) family kinase protein